MNRFDRITSILVHLQSKSYITAQELADKYVISLRTVYRDIRSLEEAGVPIISEPGKGYAIMEGYRLPPVMFSSEEALAILASSKLMEKIKDGKLRAHFESALVKIKSVLRGPDKSIIESIEHNIAVIEDQVWEMKRPIPLDTILQAIAKKSCVNIHYQANSTLEETIRLVEPIGVFQTYENWRMIAFCHLRKDYRDFRLDRISKTHLTSTPQTMAHPELSNFLNKTKKDYDLHKVVFTTCRKSWSFVGNQKYYFGFVEEKLIGERVEAHFLTPSLWGLARWTMSFADSIEVIEPEALKLKQTYIAEKFLEKVKSVETY